eukprot:Gb_02418 [translate_table: standard]
MRKRICRLVGGHTADNAVLTVLQEEAIPAGSYSEQTVQVKQTVSILASDCEALILEGTPLCRPYTAQKSRRGVGPYRSKSVAQKPRTVNSEQTVRLTQAVRKFGFSASDWHKNRGGYLSVKLRKFYFRLAVQFM